VNNDLIRSLMFLQRSFRYRAAVLICVAAFMAGGCNKPAANTNSQSETTESNATPAPPKTGFEADLDYVRKGQYTYVWVFSRKDGKPLDKVDGEFLRKNAPQVVDWVTTDGGKKVIAGTNFNLEEGNLGLLQKRFIAEDYTGR
ncbi:MAG TPA: hypothetical protein VJT50_08790, partial [Pyrinomonadaceae bacterium]|nr:hypothetical protein [Pyrinomonadaceae bacterium]